MRNGVLLITYPDSLGSDLSSLEKVLSKHFPKAITAVHVLPFYPSSADRGFAPKT
jgi:sucrose phosphorylase